VGKDQVVGVVLMLVSISIIVGYGWLLFFTEWTLLLIQLTLMIAVAAVLGVVAWSCRLDRIHPGDHPFT